MRGLAKVSINTYALTQRANPLATIPEVQVIDFRDYIGQNETSNFMPPLLERPSKTAWIKRAGSPHAQLVGVILALLCVESVGRWIVVPTVTFL